MSHGYWAYIPFRMVVTKTFSTVFAAFTLHIYENTWSNKTTLFPTAKQSKHTPYLRQQDSQHVLSLEANSQMDQGEAHVKGRGPVEELNLVSRELPGDVTTRRLVGFNSCQISLNNTCSREGKKNRIQDM